LAVTILAFDLKRFAHKVSLSHAHNFSLFLAFSLSGLMTFMQAAIARNALKRFKTLRHPNILGCILSFFFLSLFDFVTEHLILQM
jgi:hypothetical protein